MQAECADLAEAPAQNKRLSLFAISVPLAILSPFAAGVSFLAFALMAAAFLFVAIVCRSVRLGAGIYYVGFRSEEHTSELQSLMRISYAVFCLKKKNTIKLMSTSI